jgi:phosphatidylserine decarboxylase
MVGTASLPLNELISDAPKPNPETGLYGKEEDGKHEMKEFTASPIAPTCQLALTDSSPS